MANEDLKKIKEELASVIEDNINPQFDELRGKIGVISDDVGNLKNNVSNLKNDVGNIKGEISYIKSQMVTKSYLDDKLADLSGDTIIKLKKEDAKVNRLIEMMGGKKMLDEKEIKELEEIKVFPRSV